MLTARGVLFWEREEDAPSFLGGRLAPGGLEKGRAGSMSPYIPAELAAARC
jgi:hypothetical protein